jgi:hypothetical protein
MQYHQEKVQTHHHRRCWSSLQFSRQQSQAGAALARMLGVAVSRCDGACVAMETISLGHSFFCPL